MHSSNDTTSILAARTTAQRIWDRILGRTVWALDLAGQGVAAVVSLFSRGKWAVHYQVEWWKAPRVDAWTHSDEYGKTYYLDLGRVRFLTEYMTPKAPKGTQQVHHAE